MTEIDELVATLSALIAGFERVGADWAVGGSLASTAYGEPRATNDIDVVANLDESSARDLASALDGQFFVDAQSAAKAARDFDSFNIIDQRSFMKVDVFVPRPGAMGRGQLDRRRTLELVGGVEVPVLGPEDIVLQKLRWYRLTGETSDRQWRDVLAVLRSGGLDDDYLNTVAGGAGLSPLLARARGEALQSPRL